MLKLDEISVKRGRKIVLRDVSLSLPQGNTLAVVGEIGVGKSTLIAAILGFLKPFYGEMSWEGSSVRSCRPALVMQEPRSAFTPVLSLRRSVMEAVAGTDHKSDRCGHLPWRVRGGGMITRAMGFLLRLPLSFLARLL
jgi:ABC-type dipeptide/oligopeptide/nickel transport system ATPase subunit